VKQHVSHYETLVFFPRQLSLLNGEFVPKQPSKASYRICKTDGRKCIITLERFK
jgi:hypothetical protein